MLQTFLTALKVSHYERKATFPVRKRTQIIQTENVKIFQLSRPSLFIERPSLEQENALLHSRKCPSCVKKGVFYEQEEHILKYYL